VIHARRREVLYLLKDERHHTVSGEKMVKIFKKQMKAIAIEDQFGVGRLH